MLDILQKWLQNTDNLTLCWGLAAVFIRHGITTLASPDIIAKALSSMENAGILLPVFREGSTPTAPYAEKFIPIVYRSVPGKIVWVHYRIGDEPSMASPMQYVRYGIYIAILPAFSGESITYHIADGHDTTPITIKNTRAHLQTTEQMHDEFFHINNAAIHEQNFRHDAAEKIISRLVPDIRATRAQLL
jgi:hypothetical protein